MVKLLIFDWDDVFTLGSREGYFKCYHETLVEVGANLDPEEERRRLVSKWGTSHQEEFELLLKEKPHLFNEACRIFESKLFGDTFVSHLYVLPGVNPLLERLNENYTLAVATGAHPKLLKETVMPRFNIPPVFSHVMTSYDAGPGRGKPHPYMVEKILYDTNTDPLEARVIGDSESDVVMARSARVTPIVVLTGNLKRKEAEKLGVKYIVEDVTKVEYVL